MIVGFGHFGRNVIVIIIIEQIIWFNWVDSAGGRMKWIR